MKKAKRGRPAIDAAQKREVFALRLNADERTAISRAADAAGLSVSDWARQALLHALTDAERDRRTPGLEIA